MNEKAIAELHEQESLPSEGKNVHRLHLKVLKEKHDLQVFLE